MHSNIIATQIILLLAGWWWWWGRHGNVCWIHAPISIVLWNEICVHFRFYRKKIECSWFFIFIFFVFFFLAIYFLVRVCARGLQFLDQEKLGYPILYCKQKPYIGLFDEYIRKQWAMNHHQRKCNLMYFDEKVWTNEHRKTTHVVEQKGRKMVVVLVRYKKQTQTFFFISSLWYSHIDVACLCVESQLFKEEIENKKKKWNQRGKKTKQNTKRQQAKAAVAAVKNIYIWINVAQDPQADIA